MRSHLGRVLGLCALGAVCWGGVPGAALPRAGAYQPLETIKDKDAAVKSRIGAIRRVWDAVEAGEIGHADAREMLKSVAWGRANFWEVRAAAIEMLLADDPDDTRNMLGLMLPTEPSWDILRMICDGAAERGWTGLAPALVRSWSREYADPGDDQRPERAALTALFPGRPVEDVVYDVFMGRFGGYEMRDRDRIDAWTLLRRLDASGSRTVALLTGDSESAADDPLLQGLIASARDLRAVPANTPQFEWLNALRRPEHEAFWREAASAVAGLGPEQSEGLALRHAAIVRWSAAHRPEWLMRSRAELERELDKRFKKGRHVYRAGSSAIGQQETLRVWGSCMVWGDTLAALVATEVIGDPSVAGPLFAIADADQKDTSTEHGGVIDAGAGGGFTVTHFPPRATQRSGDTEFIASSEMLDAGAAALLHFHCHAQRHRNSDYAGPSEGDIGYANLQGRACIVFTFINKDTLNADYYQPGGARIDLGEVKRPRGK